MGFLPLLATPIDLNRGCKAYAYITNKKLEEKEISLKNIELKSLNDCDSFLRNFNNVLSDKSKDVD